jgi:Cys-tRNA(Pro) deacylase
MAKDKIKATQALRALDRAGARFSLHAYQHLEHGGTAEAARQLGLDEHRVIKTLVMIDNQNRPLIVLMHGDREVSTKNLARQMGVKEVRPADPQIAQRVTGYQVGGISPFGARQRPPVYVEESILELPEIYINAGKRGLLARMSPAELRRILNPTPVQVAI